MPFQTRSGKPPSIESTLDLSHLERFSRPREPAPPELPFPEPDPADLIEGPRISLLHGSAPTQIWVSRRMWRRTDAAGFSHRGRWRRVDDWTDPDCVVGMSGRFGKFKGTIFEDELGFLGLIGDGRKITELRLAQIEVFRANVYQLNRFEIEIVKHGRK